MNFNFNDQRLMEDFIRKKQEEEGIASFLSLVNRCFQDCQRDLTTSKVTEKEEKCLGKCVRKFLLVSERISIRFGESSLAKEAVPNVGQKTNYLFK